MKRKLVSQSALDSVPERFQEIGEMVFADEIKNELVALRELERVARLIYQKVHTLRVEYDTDGSRRDLKQSLADALAALRGEAAE